MFLFGFGSGIRVVMNGLSLVQKLFLFSFPVLATAGAWFGAPVVLDPYVQPTPPSESTAFLPNPALGHALFQKHCAYCHGPEGRGDGPAELWPRARAFGRDKFKFATTLNGIPTDSDLHGILKRGIPGSAMPAFGHLAESDLKELIAHLRVLTRSGIYSKVQTAQSKEGDFEPNEIQQQINRLTEVGPPLPIPATFADATPESLANGKKVFDVSCAQCHGLLGKGDGSQVEQMKNDDGSPARPKDLTTGVYKAGGSKADLYARLMLGIPGSPMPASTTLSPKDIQDVINYVQSLVKQ
jgi:cytochrome c oxidase cbb3-type subunit 2